MQRKLTAQEKRKTDTTKENKPTKKTIIKKIEVQCRYVRKLTEGAVFDFMRDMEEWHRHGYYKSTKDAEKAAETLNSKDGQLIGAIPKKRVWEYRIKPKDS